MVTSLASRQVMCPGSCACDRECSRWSFSNVRESTSVQKGVFPSTDQDFTETMKLYNPQTEGNRDCEAWRCGFLQHQFKSRDSNLKLFVLGTNIYINLDFEVFYYKTTKIFDYDELMKSSESVVFQCGEDVIVYMYFKSYTLLYTTGTRRPRRSRLPILFQN